jgi:hypothetical protein
MTVKFQTKTKKNMKNVIENFQFKGCQFVHLKNYTTKTGEVSNYLINVGAKYENALESDLIELGNFFGKDGINKITQFVPDVDKITLDEAVNEMMVSITNALSKEMENKTNQQLGQINAYRYINNGIKQHNETNQYYIVGLLVSKTVIEKGDEKKPVKSSLKTRIKNAIKYNFLKHGNFRTFILDHSEKISVNGNTLEFDI